MELTPCSPKPPPCNGKLCCQTDQFLLCECSYCILSKNYFPFQDHKDIFQHSVLLFLKSYIILAIDLIGIFHTASLSLGLLL